MAHDGASREWNWAQADKSRFTTPAEESYYLREIWSRRDGCRVLDLGAGLGRHAILFARAGLTVSALDQSGDAIAYLNDWAAREGLSIDARIGDMHELPYDDGSFDAVLAYHSISHTNADGARRILAEIRRVLTPGGEMYASFCAKDSEAFRDDRHDRVDPNTVIYREPGPEDGVMHYFVDLGDLYPLCEGFTSIRIREVGYWPKNTMRWHYYVHAVKA